MSTSTLRWASTPISQASIRADRAGELLNAACINKRSAHAVAERHESMWTEIRERMDLVARRRRTAVGR